MGIKWARSEGLVCTKSSRVDQHLCTTTWPTPKPAVLPTCLCVLVCIFPSFPRPHKYMHICRDGKIRLACKDCADSRMYMYM